MKTMRKMNSEITQNNKRLKTAANDEGYIPIDLLIEIFLRLPTISIAICRCVSKLWASLLRLPSFTELYLTRSSARPRLLFACRNRFINEVCFYSSTQPHIVDGNMSPLIASYQMKIPYSTKFERFSPIRGFVCLRDKHIVNGKQHKVSVICNPSTGQYLTLPKAKTRKRNGVVSYFGYDPVEEQYKVLFMTFKDTSRNSVFEEHQVMTLGTGQQSWRRIKCSVPHYFSGKYNQICINGVLYYVAWNSEDLIIVCFDVKSEKFSFINYMKEDMVSFDVTLINCNGKLGSLMAGNYNDFVHGESESIMLWLLEDVEKKEWSKHTFVLPSFWKDMVGGLYLHFVGVNQAKEIMLSTSHRGSGYYIFYFNTERGTVERVEIRGMEVFRVSEIITYSDHVENVKLLQMF